MEDEYIILENTDGLGYQQLTIPLDLVSVDKYLDKCCIKPGTTYAVVKIVTTKVNPSL